MNTKYFNQLLEKASLNVINPTEEERKACQELQEYISNHIPKKLYRYRRCDENSLNAFLNDQLWFSTGSKMNDDYDSMLYYDKKAIKNEIANIFDENGNIKMYVGLQKNLPEAIKSILAIVGNDNLPAFLEKFKMYTPEQIKEISKKIHNWIINSNRDLENEITTRVQKKTKFACFSERIDSPLMWGHYAASSTGFALEYDFQNSNTTNCPQCSKLGKECFAPYNGTILPVIYTNKRFDATQAYSYILRSFLLDELLMPMFGTVNINFKEQLLGPIDSLIWDRIIIHKAKEWEEEKEWRIIYTKPNDSNFLQMDSGFVIKRPTAIYLGSKISQANQKFLIDVAREKGYNIYKESVSTQNRTYKMVFTKI